jgi:hypothetical protein
MKVIKVIVDDTPWTCSKCKFCVDKMPYYCRILDRFVKEDIVFEARPDWCPLVVEDRYSVALQACLDLVDTMNGIDLDSLRATWEKAFFASIEIDRDSDPQ